MNSPLRTDEPEEDSAAAIPDKELETQHGPVDEAQSGFLPEASNPALPSNGLLGSAMKWLAEVFVDVG